MDFTVTIQLSMQHHVLEHSKAVTMTKLNVTCFFQVKKKKRKLSHQNNVWSSWALFATGYTKKKFVHSANSSFYWVRETQVKLKLRGNVWFQKISIPSKWKGIEFPGGWGGHRPRKILRGGGAVLYQFILFFPDRFHYSYMLNFLCLHFAYWSADANINLVNCTQVIFSRWSGSISGAARVQSFYQTVAD